VSLISAIAALRSAVTFAWRRPKDAAIILLLLLAGILAWRARHASNRAAELAAKIEGLPPGTKQVVTIHQDRVVTKWRDGPTKIEYRDHYLPPEGHVEIVTKEDQPDKPPEVVIKDWGFTTRLGGGVVYSGKLLPLVDLKWFYWKRYSMTVGITPQFGGIGVSRHIDDFTPFHNLEIVGMGAIGWTGERQIGIGLRTNF
jgi:hypothetical protein